MSQESTGSAETRERAAKVLREILDFMSIDAEVSAFDEEERIILDAHGAESGLIIGKPYNFPQLFYQNNFESRYDLNWHRNSHDLKIGAEFMYAKHSGTWYIQQVGRMLFNSNPSNLNSIFTVDNVNNPTAWNIAAIPSSTVREFDQNFHPGDWGISVPRPTWAVWIGDNSARWTGEATNYLATIHDRFELSPGQRELTRLVDSWNHMA